MAATLLPIPTAAGEAEPTHQLVQDVYFYTRPPDGQLRAGTTVHLVHSYGNLCRIQTSDGTVLGFVETGALRPVGAMTPPTLALPPRPSVVRVQADHPDRRPSIYDAYDASIPTFRGLRHVLPEADATDDPAAEGEAQEGDGDPNFEADAVFAASTAPPADPPDAFEPTAPVPALLGEAAAAAADEGEAAAVATDEGEAAAAAAVKPVAGALEPEPADAEERPSSRLPSALSSDLSQSLGSLNRPRIVHDPEEGYDDSEYEVYVDDPSPRQPSLRAD